MIFLCNLDHKKFSFLTIIVASITNKFFVSKNRKFCGILCWPRTREPYCTFFICSMLQRIIVFHFMNHCITIQMQCIATMIRYICAVEQCIICFSFYDTLHNRTDAMYCNNNTLHLYCDEIYNFFSFLQCIAK